GPLIGENELEVFFDVPRLELAEVDGDGRADLVAAGRHELRVFLQGEDGRFPADPDRSDPLRLLGEEDHIRNSGSVRVDVRDWDGDGRADLLVVHASGGLLRAVTRTLLHRNRGGRWDLTAPDQVFERSGGVEVDELVDLDGDGRPDLLRAFLPLGLLDLARLFVQRSVQVDAALHRNSGAGGFEPEPWVRSAFAVAFDFETLRPKGFLPTLAGDWNRDGHRDLLSGGDGAALEVWLGGPRHRFAARQARQALDTGGRLRIGDLDGDGLPDFALYDPRSPDAPIRIGRNLGNLPDTPPGIRTRDRDDGSAALPDRLALLGEGARAFAEVLAPDQLGDGVVAGRQ
ncbi:MAG TPA: VCBS repeat-containing protein, partial [Myxococcota bacterium]|nr:VCBS repeat-containing protein [Myxococcota bacterium]